MQAWIGNRCCTTVAAATGAGAAGMTRPARQVARTTVRERTPQGDTRLAFGACASLSPPPCSLLVAGCWRRRSSPGRARRDRAAHRGRAGLHRPRATHHLKQGASTRTAYPQSPPVGGPHSDRWLACGVYTKPVPKENAVHSIEHGGGVAHLPAGTPRRSGCWSRLDAAQPGVRAGVAVPGSGQPGHRDHLGAAAEAAERRGPAAGGLRAAVRRRRPGRGEGRWLRHRRR